MKITILCVGKLKEKFMKDAVNEYLKRLSKYANIEIIEIPDEKAPENLSVAQEEIVKKEEGKKILKNIKNGYVVALAVEGEQITSEDFSSFFENKMILGVSNIYFIIGGSIGLCKEVTDRADYKMSFSKMTFPHQLMRVILLEQIYRSFKIMKNEPYHK